MNQKIAIIADNSVEIVVFLELANVQFCYYSNSK